MNKMNCWEILKCGRETECPAYPNFGRDCFGVANTLCRNQVQGTFNEKIGECRSVCKFYQDMMSGQV